MTRLKMRKNFFIPVVCLMVLTSVPPATQAAERVTLRNGFAMECDHHARVEGQVRLYLGSGEDNYIEFAQDKIAGFETVPDPPPPPASPEKPTTTSIATGPAAGSQNNPQASPDAKLNPADLHEMLSKAGSEHNVDVDLLASVVKAESGGNTRAVSRAGARGLMQLMPGTATELGVQNSFAPEQNVRGGTAYLDALLKRYHDHMALALAAYNAGPEAVDKYHGIPPYHETRAYVARVIHEFNRRVHAREAQAKQAIASAAKSQGDASR